MVNYEVLFNSDDFSLQYLYDALEIADDYILENFWTVAGLPFEDSEPNIMFKAVEIDTGYEIVNGTLSGVVNEIINEFNNFDYIQLSNHDSILVLMLTLDDNLYEFELFAVEEELGRVDIGDNW